VDVAIRWLNRRHEVLSWRVQPSDDHNETHCVNPRVTAFGEHCRRRIVSWYRNDDLRIALAYGARWQPVAAAEAASLKVVEWNGKQGGLITTCYLQAYEGGLGTLSADEKLCVAITQTSTMIEAMLPQ
jgi:hypothetical protein